MLVLQSLPYQTVWDSGTAQEKTWWSQVSQSLNSANYESLSYTLYAARLQLQYLNTA